MSPGGKIQILQIPSLDNINSLEEKQEKIMQIAKERAVQYLLVWFYYLSQ